MASDNAVFEVDRRAVAKRPARPIARCTRGLNSSNNDSRLERNDAAITMRSESKLQIKQMLNLPQGKFRVGLGALHL